MMYLKVGGSLEKRCGDLICGGRVFMKNTSAQSSFCSSDTTKSCPNPSISPATCPHFSFSSNGRLKNPWTSTFAFSTSEELTPWFISCTTFNSFLYYHSFQIKYNMYQFGYLEKPPILAGKVQLSKLRIMC